jgi:hypothetical protein
MKPAESTKSGAESRRTPRKTLRTLGHITHPRSAQAVDCTVMDLSSTGAKISLGVGGQRKAFVPTFDIPQMFCLQIPRDNISVDCQIAWQTDNMLGVKFLSTFRPLKAPKTKAPVEMGLRKADAFLRKPEGGLRKVK